MHDRIIARRRGPFELSALLIVLLCGPLDFEDSASFQGISLRWHHTHILHASIYQHLLSGKTYGVAQTRFRTVQLAENCAVGETLGFRQGIQQHHGGVIVVPLFFSFFVGSYSFLCAFSLILASSSSSLFSVIYYLSVRAHGR